MMCDDQYSLTQEEKEEIAQNLIDIVSNNKVITAKTKSFVIEWCYSGPEEKVQDLYDVWDIVLKNYMPETRPILLRSSKSHYNGEIASFSGSIMFIKRYYEKGVFLLVCDTKESTLNFPNEDKPGNYQYSFFPLFKVLEIAKESGGWGFNKCTFDYIGEQEYIVRTSKVFVTSFKWIEEE